MRRDLAATTLERGHKLDLMVHVFGQRWIGHRATVRNDGVRRLGKEERRFAHVLSHFLDVLHIIAADAPKPPDWKIFAGTGDRDRRLRRLRNDIGLAVGAHIWNFKLEER